VTWTEPLPCPFPPLPLCCQLPVLVAETYSLPPCLTLGEARDALLHALRGLVRPGEAPGEASGEASGGSSGAHPVGFPRGSALSWQPSPAAC